MHTNRSCDLKQQTFTHRKYVEIDSELCHRIYADLKIKQQIIQKWFMKVRIWAQTKMMSLTIYQFDAKISLQVTIRGEKYFESFQKSLYYHVILYISSCFHAKTLEKTTKYSFWLQNEVKIGFGHRIRIRDPQISYGRVDFLVNKC